MTSRYNINMNKPLKLYYFSFDAISKDFKLLDSIDFIGLYVKDITTGIQYNIAAYFNMAYEGKSDFSKDLFNVDIFEYNEINNTGESGTAQGITSNTIQLESSFSDVDDYYIDYVIEMRSGVASGTRRTVIDYNGSTRTATLSENWSVTPSVGDEFFVSNGVINSYDNYVINHMDDVDGYFKQIGTGIYELYLADLFMNLNSDIVFDKNFYFYEQIIGRKGNSVQNIEKGYPIYGEYLVLQTNFASYKYNISETLLTTTIDNTNLSQYVILNSSISLHDLIENQMFSYTNLNQIEIIDPKNDSNTIELPFYYRLDKFYSFFYVNYNESTDTLTLKRTDSDANLIDFQFSISDVAQGNGDANNIIRLDDNASSIDDFYNNTEIQIVGGTGIGQEKTIIDYDGTTKIATVDGVWGTLPDSTSQYRIYTTDTAQGGNQSGIVLSSFSSVIDDEYNGKSISIVSGTGNGQSATIVDYDGSTKFALVDSVWEIIPDSSSIYSIEVESSNVYGTNDIYLSDDSSGVDDYYRNMNIKIVNGSGSGQSRTVKSYDATTNRLIVDNHWNTQPDPTSEYEISVNGNVSSSSMSGIVLDGTSSNQDDYYNGKQIKIISGTGEGQVKYIIDYDGSTYTAYVDSVWDIVPDNTSDYIIFVEDNDTAQSGGISTTIVLSDDSSSVDDYYNGMTIEIVSGTGEGETKTITDYDGATKTATINSGWSLTPDNTSVYDISLRNVAQSAFQSYIVLDSDSSVLDDYYNGMPIQIVSGSGIGQSATIVDYDGSTRQAIINKSLSTLPNSSSTYKIIVDTGTSQGTNAIRLSGTSSSTYNYYKGMQIKITDGLGKDQSKTITHYDGNTKIATVDSFWSESFNENSNYLISLIDQAQSGISNHIILSSSSSSSDGYYNNLELCITSGAGIGQCAQIRAYDGSTKIAKVDSLWSVIPDGTSVYRINIISGTSVAVNTIQLSASDTAVDDYYNGLSIEIVDGSGEGQTNNIVDYNSSTKIAILENNWVAPVDTSSRYRIYLMDNTQISFDVKYTLYDNVYIKTTQTMNVDL